MNNDSLLPLRKNAGKLIRNKRISSGCSLRKFAEVLGVAPSTIMRIENGHTKRASMELIKRLSDVSLIPLNRLTPYARMTAEPTEPPLTLTEAYECASPEIQEAVRKILSIN